MKATHLAAMLAVAASATFVCTHAEAGEPSAALAQQMRRGFEACDAKDWGKYESQRAFVQKEEPAILKYNGKIEKYDVQSTLARCDRDLAQVNAAQAANDKLMGFFREAEGVCSAFSQDDSDKAIARYRAAREKLLKANGGKDSFKDGDGTHSLKSCDRDVEEIFKNRKARADSEAASAARQKKDQEDAANREKRQKAAVAALKGDRARLLKEHGYPFLPQSPEDLGKTSTWTWNRYDTKTGTIDGHDVSIDEKCAITVTFSGDRASSPQKSGRACATTKW